MYKNDFINYLLENEKKAPATTYQYGEAIGRISKNYSNNIGEYIDIYQIDNIDELINIQTEYEEGDAYSEFGSAALIHKQAFSAYIRFMEMKNGTNNKKDTTKKINEGNIILKSLRSQIDELFQDYKELDELDIGEKRIDLLLENKNNLLAIKVIIGEADEKIVGPLLDYMGQDKFDEKTINGIIIAGNINDSLKRAAKKITNINIWTYKINLTINKN